jgi:hypothetical protein
MKSMKKTLSLVVIAALLTAIACRKPDSAAPANSSSAPGATPGTPIATSDAVTGMSPALAKLTPNERKWGISPTLNDKVTYQPDVIIMEHGADAVKAMASNGLTWTIDANAPHASDIQVDKILFATGRVMGRVLKVDRKGDGLEVTLGPVELTDVIKDCDLSATQAIEMSSMLVYTAPDYPGATTHDEPEEQPTSFAAPEVPVLFASYDRSEPFQDSPAIDQLKEILIDNFLFIPVCCQNIGVSLEHKGNGVKMRASAIVELGTRWVEFHLVIRNATIYTASVELHGVAGFRVVLEAGTAPGISGNIHQNFFLPVDWTFPVTGMAVPFSVIFRQTLSLTTIFTAQSATIHAEGEYAFNGSFFAGKKDGGDWGASGPSNVTTVKNLASTVDGASVGVNGLVFAYGAKIIVGIGAYGFVTGPYVGYNTTVGLEKGSSMTVAMMPSCRAATYVNSLKYGVGYQIPKLVTNAINFFLRAINVKPITGEGGYGQEKTLTNQKEFYPASCDKAPAT